MRSAKMNRFIHDNESKSVQSTTHAHTVERFIITFKHKLYRKLDSLNQSTTEWVKHMYNII